MMSDNELELDGRTYVETEYLGEDCGTEKGTVCAFADESMSFCRRIACTPDKRPDKRNVIFVEKVGP